MRRVRHLQNVPDFLPNKGFNMSSKKNAMTSIGLVNRRLVVRGLGVGSLGSISGFGGLAHAQGRKGSRVRGAEGTHTFIQVFLRGGCDGLSVVVPKDNTEYVRRRPSIRVYGSGKDTDTNLDKKLSLGSSGFALAPGMAPMKALWDAGELSFVHAVGTPTAIRSHFDVQDIMDSGGGEEPLADGWMNRGLVTSGPKASGRRPGDAPRALDALALGTSVPLSLSGAFPHLALSSKSAGKRWGAMDRLKRVTQTGAADGPGDQPLATDLARQWNAVGRRAWGAMDDVQDRLDRVPASDVTYPKGGEDLALLARLLRAGLRPRGDCGRGGIRHPLGSRRGRRRPGQEIEPGRGGPGGVPGGSGGPI